MQLLKTPLMVAFTALALSSAHASDGLRWGDGIGFYVGVDGLATIASGAFAGLANPNQGRLSLLFDHGNHFHGIGVYSYSGTAAAPVVSPTNANNRIPELSSRNNEAASSLRLQPGTGLLAGKWVSGVLASEAEAFEYSHLGIASVQSLSGVNAAFDVLYNSSGARWNTPASDVLVGLKLESSTPGLKVSINGQLDVFGQGSVFVLGDLNNLSALPVLYTDGSAAPGVYSAEFSLVKLGGNAAIRDGGLFNLDVAVPVPEPESWGLAMAGLMVAGTFLRRRSRSQANGLGVVKR